MAVSLRLVYLIFDRLLDWLTLLGRTSSSKDLELPRLRAAVGRALVVDMAGVEYVDHRLLLTLDAYGRGNGIAVSLRSAPPFVARLMEVLPVFSLQLAKSGAQG